MLGFEKTGSEESKVEFDGQEFRVCIDPEEKAGGVAGVARVSEMRFNGRVSMPVMNDGAPQQHRHT